MSGGILACLALVPRCRDRPALSVQDDGPDGDIPHAGSGLLQGLLHGSEVSGTGEHRSACTEGEPQLGSEAEAVRDGAHLLIRVELLVLADQFEFVGI